MSAKSTAQSNQVVRLCAALLRVRGSIPGADKVVVGSGVVGDGQAIIPVGRGKSHYGGLSGSTGGRAHHYRPV